MLWTISVTVTLLWVLGTATDLTLGGLLHVLFAITILCVLFMLATRRGRLAAIPLPEDPQRIPDRRP